VWRDFGAGTTAAPAIAACERVMILQQLKGGSVSSVMRTIVAQEGPKGVFKATTPTVAREGVFNATLFGVADIVAEETQKVIPHKKISKVAASLTTGAIVGVVTTPLNTVKTVMQESMEPAPFFKTTKKIVHEQGVKGLFKGVVPRTILVGGLMVVMGEAKDFFPIHLPSVCHTT
jgi:hypothetical protein